MFAALFRRLLARPARKRRGSTPGRLVVEASCFIVEALENRRMLDATIFDSGYPTDPSGNNYFGVQTDSSQVGEWSQHLSYTSSNIPAHSHVSAVFNIAVDIQIDPNTGQSITSQTQDSNGDVILS